MSFLKESEDPKLSEIDFSCVIPAYNEEACLATAVSEILETLDKSEINYELILVNNGSSDQTAKIIDQLSALSKRIKPLHFQKNQGYGGALIEGFAQSSGTIIGFTTADGEATPESLVKLYRVLNGTELSLCKARRLNRQDGFLRKVYSFIYHLLVRLLLDVQVTDVNGYPLLFKKSAFQAMRLTQRDWMINLEILYQTTTLGFLMGEIDTQYRKRMGGSSHVRWYNAVESFFKTFYFWYSTKWTRSIK